MKKILLAGVMALGLIGNAAALTITATLNSFQSTDADLNGAGPAGGIGTFSLLSDVTGTSVDFLGAEFLGLCLEPDEKVSVGSTYSFTVADLADAPTATSGMGPIHAGWIESLFVGLGLDSIDDVAAAGQTVLSAVQMGVYEAGYEQSDTFDWAGGNIRLTGVGSSLATQVAAHVADNPLGNLDMFGLLNTAQVPAGNTGSLHRAQDFMVVAAATPVNNPDSLLLFGLGLLAMAGAAKSRKL